MKAVQTIAEIGINHNGSLELAKKLIDIAAFSGFDYVKFQKRNPEVCVPPAVRDKPKSTPWGEMTYFDYKMKIEFGRDEYNEIDDYCSRLGIKWFASVWDEDSVDFMSEYVDVMKVPSALITNTDLVKHARSAAGTLMISTGMSDEREVCDAIKFGDPDVIFHTCSDYPSKMEDLKLEYIKWLKKHNPSREIGYSGHEFGLATTVAAVALGATWVERHVTLDRRMWGSDQSASVEPSGMIKLIKSIRDVEAAMSGYGEREVLASEMSKRDSLRG